MIVLLRGVRKRRKHPYRHSEKGTDQVKFVYHKQVLEWQSRGGITGESEKGNSSTNFFFAI